MAHAIPVAVFDATRVDQWLEVRRAQGTENYLDFAGGTEHPEAGEVIFADALGRAHARRWTHRQSGLSAVRDDTARVLIVAEALHASARADVLALTAALAHASMLGCGPRLRVADPGRPAFRFLSPRLASGTPGSLRLTAGHR